MAVKNKKYSTAKWKKTREYIKYRDNDSCRLCGLWANEIHHIRKSKYYPELFFEVDNLILLCNRCHKFADLNALNKVIGNEFLEGEELLDYVIKNDIKKI